MLSNYTKDFASLEKALGTNKYNEMEYDTPINISCRKQEGNKMIKGTDETVVSAKTVYYTNDEVLVGDKMDGNIVYDAHPMKDVEGKTVGYKVVV